MRTEENIEKDFDSVAFFRNIKEQMAKELAGKTFEQQKEILKKFLSGQIPLITPKQLARQ
jgi:hypothetical protein